jgi:hypothetical protein
VNVQVPLGPVVEIVREINLYDVIMSKIYLFCYGFLPDLNIVFASGGT